METVTCLYSAAIPVGHRVEVRWFQASNGGGMFGTKTEEQPHQPLVKELDTGIEYMGDWMLKHSGSVRRCRVVTVAWSECDVQTHLDVEPD